FPADAHARVHVAPCGADSEPTAGVLPLGGVQVLDGPRRPTPLAARRIFHRADHAGPVGLALREQDRLGAVQRVAPPWAKNAPTGPRGDHAARESSGILVHRQGLPVTRALSVEEDADGPDPVNL